MKVLLSGGAGYIGSHIALALLDRGWRIVTIDNLSKGYRQAIPGGQFYQADLADLTALTRIFEAEKFDAVIHLAASSLVGESVQKPERYFQNNLANGLNLLQVMLQTGVSKLVFSSTAAVYGDPEECPISENHPQKPGNPYGLSKLYFEGMLDWFNRSHNFQYVSLRYFNAAGADPVGRCGEAHLPESHLIPLILQIPLGQKPEIEIFGSDYPTPDGTCVRDYIHVSDLAQAHVLALDYLESGGKPRIYNLGNQCGFSNLEVINTAEQVVGQKIPYRFGPRRPGDPAQLVASSVLIRKELGWQPRYPGLDEIVATAWNWHREHPNGYHS